jgi:predicted nuclease of predicted toxin-antitoxin system
MSLIRLQADANLPNAIVLGVRRIAAVEFAFSKDRLADGTSDPVVLSICADEGLILVTRDQKTMPSHFAEFVRRRDSPGLILVPQTMALSLAIDNIADLCEYSLPGEFANAICWANTLGFEYFR